MLDIFSHILPAKYYRAVGRKAPSGFHLENLNQALPTITRLEERFRLMDRYDGYRQILTVASPAVESVFGPEDALELSRIANDELAEMVAKYPDRFAGGVAILPMNDVDAALRELDRAINELHLKGIQVFTSVEGRPMSSPEFKPIYHKMAQARLPIWIHPHRTPERADYKDEKISKYLIYSLFGWPFETTAAMTRLVFSGILDEFPDIKFLTHHCGAMVPYFRDRISQFYKDADHLLKANFLGKLQKPPIDYYRMFYHDTAISGNTSGLMCAYAFCGAERMLFGTDMPFDAEQGEFLIRETIRSIREMDISESEKQDIFENNARKLLQLDL